MSGNSCRHERTVGQATSVSRGGSAKWCLAVALTLLVFGVVGFGFQVASDSTLMTVGTILSVIGAVLAFIAICVARGRVREQSGIEGSAFGDCCLSFWCGPCSVCQILNNLGAPYKGPFAGYEKLPGEEQAKPKKAPSAAAAGKRRARGSRRRRRATGTA